MKSKYSHVSFWKGKKLSAEFRKKLSLAHIGLQTGANHPRWKGGKEALKLLNSKCERCGILTSSKTSRFCNQHYREFTKGVNHPRWKGGISKDVHSTKEPRYKEWRMKVFTRDNFICRIADINCRGQLQAHHILPWAEYEELRYEINNGITLCLAHHPRKRAEVKRLSPYFQELVSVSNDSD